MRLIIPSECQLGTNVYHGQKVAVSSSFQDFVIFNIDPLNFAAISMKLDISDSFISHTDWHHQCYS